MKYSIMPARLAAMAVLFAMTGQAVAQPPPQVASPEVMPDRHIVFRILAPKAETVRLSAGDIPDSQWKSFDSLAITDRGPLFAASLVPGKGGVTAKNATGVWACDFTGAPRLLFRTGDTVGGKVVKTFTLLKATVGNLGVTRSFNNTAQVVWLATFTDKTTAIIRTEVP